MLAVAASAVPALIWGVEAGDHAAAAADAAGRAAGKALAEGARSARGPQGAGAIAAAATASERETPPQDKTGAFPPHRERSGATPAVDARCRPPGERGAGARASPWEGSRERAAAAAAATAALERGNGFIL